MVTRIASQSVFSAAVVCCYLFFAAPTGFAQKPAASPDQSRNPLPGPGAAAASGGCGCPSLPSLTKTGKSVPGSVNHELDLDTLEAIMSNRGAMFGGWQPGLNALRLTLEKKSPPAPVRPDIKLQEGFLADELTNDGRRTLPSARGGAARAQSIAADKDLLMNSLIATIARTNKYGEPQPYLRATTMLVMQFITSDLIAAGNDRPFIRGFVRRNRQALYGYIGNAGVVAAQIEKARASHPTSGPALTLDLYDMANASLDVLTGNDKSVRPLARVTPTSRDDGEMLARDAMAVVQTRRQYGGDAVPNSPQDIIACRAFAALVQLASPPNGDPALRRAIFDLAAGDLGPLAASALNPKATRQILMEAGRARAAIHVAHAIGFGDAEEALSIAKSWFGIVLGNYDLSARERDPAWRERYAQIASHGVSTLKWFEEPNPNVAIDMSSVVAQSNREQSHWLRLRLKDGSGGPGEKLMANAYDTAIVTEHAGGGPVNTTVCANDRKEPLPMTTTKPSEPDAGNKNVAAPKDGKVAKADPPKSAEKPKPQSDVLPDAPLKGCCACVEKLELLFIGRNSKPAKSWTKSDEQTGETKEVWGKDSYGHEFKILIYYKNKKIDEADEKPGDLVLKWMEKSHRPPENNVRAGVNPDDWANIPEVLGKYWETEAVLTKGTFGQWTRYDRKSCPWPNTPGDNAPKKIELTDIPRIRYGYSRTMDFDITVESTDKCSCAHKALQILAQQVLETNPDNKDTKFYAPPGKAVTNRERVQGKEPRR